MINRYINNGKIAEFMGAKHYLKNSHTSMYRFSDGKNYRQGNLRYHASWSLLIPVAKKIIEEYGDTMNINNLINAGGQFDIERIYSEVVRLIKIMEKT